MKSKLLFILVILVLSLLNCTKEPGEGGKASIKGKVFAKYYNSTYTLLIGKSYAPEEDVYIVYGNNISYNDHIKTNYDGSYEFKYLRKGKYKIYVYSKDSTLTNPAKKYPVIINTEITERKQSIVLDDLVIFD
ncbi:MAG: hypothetical protein KA792_09290 [Bacteroidales bacterium]|nr:hypothetical protein [Bacteroidales bacterium]